MGSVSIFDLHCDTATACEYWLKSRSLRDGAQHISLARAEYLEKWAQIFAIFIPDEFRGNDAIAYYERALAYIRRQQEKEEGKFRICKSEADIVTAHENHACAGIISVEGGCVLAGDVSRLEQLYEDGVRLITLTWNAANELADGCGEPNAKGLTQTGIEAVRRMNALDMVIDVSHLADAGFFDVAKYSEKPFVASHSNSRALCAHRRNLTDEMFDIICQRGGLVGLNFCCDFLRENGQEANVQDILRHAARFVERGGEKTVCMGADFDGTDVPSEIRGIDSMGELYELFLREGFGKQLTDDIFFGNARRFFAKVMDHSF